MPSRARQRGASRSSRNVARDAVDAVGSQDVRRSRVRSSRVVLIPRRWDQVRRDAMSTVRPTRRARQAMVTRKPDTPGRARSNPSNIVQGMPDRFGFTCYLVCVFPFQHTSPAGAASARHSLRPLCWEGQSFCKARARIAPRGCRVMFTLVIASEAKQSRMPRADSLDCFVAPLLAMTDTKQCAPHYIASRSCGCASCSISAS
jgi:hypothetical protein